MKDNKQLKIPTALSPSDLQELRKGFASAEVNFLQYPIGSLDKKFKGSQIVFKDRIPVGDSFVDIEWEVTGNAKYGLPGPSAVELDNVLTKLIQEPSRRINGMVPKFIKTTYYELAKEIGEDTSGRAYNRIKRDLLKLRTCSIVSRGAYKQKNNPSPYDSLQSISKYQAIVLKGQPAESWVPSSELGKDGMAGYVYILLGDAYWTSLNEHYTKPINYIFMMSLGSVSLERIYQLLSLGFQTRMKPNGDDKLCLNYNYEEFCGRLPIKTDKTAFMAKGKLRRMLNKMVAAGYVENFLFEFAGSVDRWFIRFFPGPKALEELEVIRGQRMLFENLNGAGLILKRSRKAVKPIVHMVNENDDNWDPILKQFEGLPEVIQNQIRDRAQVLVREKYGNFRGEMTQTSALVDAIKEYLQSQEAAVSTN